MGVYTRRTGRRVCLLTTMCMLLLGCELVSYYGYYYFKTELAKNKYNFILRDNGLLHTQTLKQPLVNLLVARPEVRHIGFLKVPKAGSSTLTNIFYRFGLKRNLTFVLPNVKNEIYSGNILPAPEGLSFDMLCNHARFSKELFTFLLPKDTVYIAIVRDPLTLFVSAANYCTDVFHMPYLMAVPQNDFLLNLIRYPKKYDWKNFSNTKNLMAMSFGFRKAHIDNPKLVQAYLEELRDFFTFVLVLEHIDESLIVMKRKLNWTFADILYVPKNVHRHTFTINASTAEHNGFKDRNWLDYKVYNFFNSIFLAEMAKQTKSLESEVSAFRKVLYEVQNFCSYRTSTKTLTIPESRYNPEFNVTEKDCKYMAFDELPILKALRQKRIKQLGQNATLTGRVVGHHLEWVDVDRLKRKD